MRRQGKPQMLQAKQRVTWVVDTLGLVLEPSSDVWPRLMIVWIYTQDSAYRGTSFKVLYEN
jgi:hypothetical protein